MAQGVCGHQFNPLIALGERGDDDLSNFTVRHKH